MKLVHTSDYTIRLVREWSLDADPLCEVMVSGQATGKVLQGAVLQAALTWHDYVLLFVTDDVLFEEGLSIYLLDRHLNVVDYARMYWMYATGIFSIVDLTEDNIVRFNFLGDLRWTLRLYDQEKFAIPFVRNPLGVHRSWKMFRKFEISRSGQGAG